VVYKNAGVATTAPRWNDGVISSANFVMMLGKLVSFGPVRFSGSCILVLACRLVFTCRITYFNDNIKCFRATNAPKCPLNNDVSLIHNLVVKLSNTSTTGGNNIVEVFESFTTRFAYTVQVTMLRIIHDLYRGFATATTRWEPFVEQELSTLPEHISSLTSSINYCLF
jgi:hypothetical protein